MEIPPRFGYHLATDQYITNGAVTWANAWSTRLFFRFSPRYSLPIAGVAVYISQTTSGNMRAALHHTFLEPIWNSINMGEYTLSPGGLGYQYSLPTNPGRFVLDGMSFGMAQGACHFVVAMNHPNPYNVTFVTGPDFRASDTCWHGYGHYGTAFWSNNTWSSIDTRFNMQIIYRMPDGSLKFFEPLWTGALSDQYTNTGLRVRFKLPDGMNIRVDGVVLSHFTKQGSPGGLKAVLWKGSTMLLESDPFPSSWNPPSAANQMSFYIPFLGDALLSGGNTYDLEVTVVGTHDSSNRFVWKTMVMDTSAIPDWWTYRMVIGGVEDWSKVPPMLLFTLDLNSPFS